MWKKLWKILRDSFYNHDVNQRLASKQRFNCNPYFYHPCSHLYYNSFCYQIWVLLNLGIEVLVPVTKANI